MSTEHILIVEDAKLIRNLLQSRLEAEGYQVTTAGKISDALQATHTEVPDLLILDLALDGEDPFCSLTDGFAFLSMLRRNHPKADIATIIYTVSHTPRVEERARAMGAVAVIEKKGSIARLLEAVRTALADRKKKQAESAAIAPDASPEPESVSVDAPVS
ncbi:MAG TPA: response regulator [Methylomirabilota bacterium]|nr:response regulator [Methylomirabilota bacterium]